MSKRLLIEMPDGFVWQIPLEFVAACKSSAVFTDSKIAEIMGDDKLTDIEKLNKLETSMNEVFKSDMSDENILVTWGRDNLEWKDVVKYATVFTSPDTSETYTAGWKSGEMKTIEVDDELEKQAMRGM